MRFKYAYENNGHLNFTSPPTLFLRKPQDKNASFKDCKILM